MTDLETRLTEAMRRRAEAVQESDLRPADPPSQAVSAGRTTPPPRLRHSSWLLPLSTAAAIVAVVVTLTVVNLTWHTGGGVITDQPSTGQPPARHHHSPAPAPPTGTPIVPRGFALPVLPPRSSDLADTGRRYDIGKLEGWNGKSGSHMVLYLKRLTVAGVPDTRIARDGLHIKAHTDMPYVDIGHARYAIPVAPGATFVFNNCQPSADGSRIVLDPQRESGAAFVHRVRYVSGVLVRLDASGRAVAVQTDGGC